MKKRNTTYRLNKVDYTIFIVCSIAAIVMLYLFYRDLHSFTIKQTEEPIARIYFKKNTAQRKFADSDIWEMLTDSSAIYDGDRIRTSKNAEAHTEFADSGIQIQLREKSMIQISQNKNQQNVAFVGGEIFVATNAAEQETLVIHSGKKDVAVSNASEVKIAVPEISDAALAGEEAAGDSSLLIEVKRGQVQVSNTARQTLLVQAGETVIFKSTQDGMENARISEDSTMPTESVKEGTEKTFACDYAKFKHSNFWDELQNRERYNYGYNVPLADVSERFKIIPKNSILEVEISGTPNKDLHQVAIQMSTGQTKWKRAHEYTDTYPNRGNGMKQDTPFVIKRKIMLDSSVVYTDRAIINISYEPRILDEPVVMKDFKVRCKVVSLNGGAPQQKIAGGLSKTLEYDRITLFKNIWGSGPDDYSYQLHVNLEKIFDAPASLPKGTKIKVSVSGSSDADIQWLAPSIRDENGIIWVADYNQWALRFSDSPTTKNVPFAYSRQYTSIAALKDPCLAVFELTADREKLSAAPVLTDLRISLEVE